MRMPFVRLFGLALVVASLAAGWHASTSPDAMPDAMPLVGASVGGRTAPDGTVLDCDYPVSRHLRNKGGSDTAGLCVFTSGEMAADWANIPVMIGFQAWMTRRPGGGTPDKLDAMIAQYCRDHGVPVPAYVQFRPGSCTQEICRSILASGRMLCHTYQVSPTRRYSGRWIEHMVNSVAGSKGTTWAVLDNNYPGDTAYEWQTSAEWWNAVTGGGRRKPWAWCWLAPPPPPMPRN